MLSAILSHGKREVLLRMLIKWLIILVLMVAGPISIADAAPAYHSMMNPVEGELEVTSDFGWRTHPTYTGLRNFILE